ncbi:hypothetical protein B0H19DRAFT_1206321 [Mycena capillaripes]|nr:hypothetical protein B0H19DRAFT_1206321 [Mycena capillaripes]
MAQDTFAIFQKGFKRERSRLNETPSIPSFGSVLPIRRKLHLAILGALILGISAPNLTDALKLSTPVPNPWTPLSLSVCSFGMPTYYGPCVAQTLANVEYAEELLYPDFELREPYFAQEEHRQRWRSYTQSDPEFKDRGALYSGWMRYKGQSGQNFGTFAPDSWSGCACMSSEVDTSPIQPLTDADFNSTTPVHPTALIALHGDKTVNELWSQMGFPEDHVLHSESEVAARSLIFSCRAVLVHPWLSLKTLEFLGIQRTMPLLRRPKVVYMSRSHGGTSNAGRRVVNEEEVLRGITTFLADRDRGEELVVFDLNQFGNITELFSWFSENVAAVIGPHGGAMINYRWANKDILVIEFMPANRIAMMIYEEVSLLSQTYATVLSYDMKIEVDDVVSLLGKHLGVVSGDPLRKSYSWRSKELGF